MTTVKTLAVHAIVRATYPRPPPTDADQLAMATGHAIDAACAELGHRLRSGRRLPRSALLEIAARDLTDRLDEAGLSITDAERAPLLATISEVLQAYRESPIAGLARPRSRVLLIDGVVAVYAQPDFWDGRSRIYEMKSYAAIPPPPDVALQIRFFQLAFPRFEATLVCLDRHVRPPRTLVATLPPPTSEETQQALRLARDVTEREGIPKVLEYIEGPFVSYATAASGP